MSDLRVDCDWNDGTLHIILPEPPERICVTLPDKRGREVYSARVHEYVPVVRCRDCKRFTANKEFWIEPPKVPFPMIGATSDCCDFWAGTECKVDPDGFCSNGERR